MATAKKSTSTKSNSNPTKGDVAPKHVGEDTLGEGTDNIAKVAFDKVKDAVPSMDGVASAAGDVRDYVHDTVNVDVRGLADDATEFVRRNPGTSLAVAAGVGILIGILATKRS